VVATGEEITGVEESPIVGFVTGWIDGQNVDGIAGFRETLLGFFDSGLVDGLF